MAVELPEAGMVAHCVAISRAAILEPLLSFLEGALARGPMLELDAAVLFVTLTLPMAYLASVILLYHHVIAEAGTLLVLISVASSLFPSACVRFVFSVAVGCARALDTALGFVERVATARRRGATSSSCPSSQLALLVLIAHLLLGLGIVVFVIERARRRHHGVEAGRRCPVSSGSGMDQESGQHQLTIAFRILGFEIDMIWDILLDDRN